MKMQHLARSAAMAAVLLSATAAMAEPVTTASFGIGVDVNRHFNVSLVYTGYAYSSVYYDYEDYLENLDRADTLMFGIEGRF